ncbi:two-component system chemotaxis response regulator CheB [Pseudoduganella lurida]|uniref:protein-glutamate methylesterase n=1 Tax=Pseudoduganella lurida TaxID=1036180 RepID=A0A562QV30_9BURK|nr:chemotaxis protein CheB [Pseudoduganella lurida]TWI60635.1 two-component system chemotaxis response regulator CheB [Pseudoduganella lurida]
MAQASLDLALHGRRFGAVAIGASAGGVNALIDILPGLPRSYPLPIVVVLHVMRGRQNQLVDVFRQRVELRVEEAADKDALAPGTLYFAPADYHLSIEEGGVFSLSLEPPVHFARPAIDMTMESAADVYGRGLCGVLLTGANHDGAAGLAAIGKAGGLTVVQEPAEAQVAVMPNEAIRRRAPDLVLPLRDIRKLLAMLTGEVG